MKPVPASLIAMAVGWALPLIGMAIAQLATSGRTADIGATAAWVGLFALIGWLAAVLPIMARFGRTRLMSDLRWSWLGWSGLGAVVFTILVTPIMGTTAFEILWWPSLMGCVAGPVFSLLVQVRKKKNA